MTKEEMFKEMEKISPSGTEQMEEYCAGKKESQALLRELFFNEETWACGRCIP